MKHRELLGWGTCWRFRHACGGAGVSNKPNPLLWTLQARAWGAGRGAGTVVDTERKSGCFRQLHSLTRSGGVAGDGARAHRRNLHSLDDLLSSLITQSPPDDEKAAAATMEPTPAPTPPPTHRKVDPDTNQKIHGLLDGILGATGDEPADDRDSSPGTTGSYDGSYDESQVRAQQFATSGCGLPVATHTQRESGACLVASQGTGSGPRHTPPTLLLRRVAVRADAGGPRSPFHARGRGRAVAQAKLPRPAAC